MRQISLLGHRGARGLLPENTLPSLALPFDYGAHGIEFDLQLSKDNQWVIYHDLRLKNSITRDARGHWIKSPGPAVKDLTLKQLRTYKIGRINKRSRYGMLFQKQKGLPDQVIPTLEDLLEHQDKSGLNQSILNIEIKHSPEEPEICLSPAIIATNIVETIHRYKLKDRSVISCFNWDVIKAVKQLDESLKVGCLTIRHSQGDTISPHHGRTSLWNAGLDIRDFKDNTVEMALEFGADYWIPFYKNIQKVDLANAHSRGMTVFTWTVNHRSSMRKLMRWGIDGIITDYPDKLQEAWIQCSSNPSQ